MILSCKSVLSLVFILFFSIALTAQEDPEEYRKTLEMADSYFNRGDYINAKASYTIAVKLNPADQYAKDRLQQTMNMIKVQMQQNALYTEKILMADDLYKENDLQGALVTYRSALEFLPGDPYAAGRVQEIEKTFADAAKKEQDFAMSVAEGDKLQAAGNLPGALAEFRKASSIKPEEGYPKQKAAEIEQLLADQQAVAGSYEKALADAEVAVNRQRFDEAILQLESAGRMKPAEEFPKKRMGEVRQMKKDYESYSSIIETADNYYIQKDFEKAKTEYEKAVVIKPGDEYPKSMLDKIGIALMDISKANRSSYELAIAQADKLYSQQDYEQAMVEYKNALRFKPEEDYAKQRIGDINNMLSLKKSQDEAYAQSISRADQLFKEQRYDEALEAYNQAIGFRPMEQYPKVKIDEIRTIQANLQNQRQIYQSLIAGADKLFFADDYVEAREQYRKASDLFPREQYPLDQIKMINEILGLRDTYNKAITDADRMMYEKRYDEALAEYRKAAAMDENEIYAEGKIYEIESMIVEQQIAKAQQRQYDSVLVIADDQFAAGDHVRAMETYKAAQAILPGEGYPQIKMEEINRIAAENAAAEKLDKQFAEALAKADQLLAAGTYNEAIRAYEGAAKLKPGESYPSQKIAEANSALKEIAAKEAHEKQYQDAISAADRLMAAKYYTDALAAYQNALSLKPGEEYPASKVNEITAILGDIAAKEALDKQYAEALAEADRLLDAKDYSSAIRAYEGAAKLKPGESYPSKKIAEANDALSEIAAKAADEKRYQDAISDADRLMAAKNYTEAMAAYQNALTLKPAEEYPASKVNEITAILGDIAAKEALDKQYAEALAEADRLLDAKDYASAIRAYEGAAKLKPGESYPSKRIAEANDALTEIAVKEADEKRYQDAISAADRLVVTKNYTEALAEYQNALKLKPAEEYPTSKVNEIKAILEDIAAKEAFDKQYSDIISQGEALLLAKDYSGALTAYESATKLKPGDTFPASRIEEINNILSEIAAKEAVDKKYSEVVANADKLMAAGDYTGSLQTYQEANRIKPGEDYPRMMIGEVTNILGKIAAEEALDKQYAEAVAVADKLLAVKDYNNALVAYKDASAIKPGEKYPNDKIAEINGILSDIAAKEALDKQYAENMASGDKLLAEKNYEGALNAYQSARTLKPGERIPAEKINEINGILADITAREAAVEKQYNDAIVFADKHLAARDYENASKEYNNALAVKPGQEYPAAKLAEIAVIEQEIRKQKELEAQYNKAIARADEFLKQEKFEEARFAYQEALKVKPGEAYPENQISGINSRLQVLAQEREQAYSTAVERADAYFQQRDWAMAKVQYERATELKPDQVYPLDQLKVVNEEVMKQKQVVQAEYDKAIADADKYYASKLYDNAIEAYRASSILKPDEEYPKEMVRRILKMLSERSIVQINKNPLLIPNNTQRKFDFLSVSAKDRKSNYLYFTARNVSDKEYKLIINFGQNAAKNGGFVVKVPAGGEMNEYIVRISAQYKWFSDDNNWITFYPEGGDIEVSLLQISYSD